MAGLAGRPRSPPNPSASLNIVEETTTAQKQAMSAEMMKLLNKHITDLRDKSARLRACIRAPPRTRRTLTPAPAGRRARACS